MAPIGAGDLWTWLGLDAQHKMMVAFHLGGRDADDAKLLMDDLANRLANRVQLTTDGHRAYLEAVETAFGNATDYAQLVKFTARQRARSVGPVRANVSVPRSGVLRGSPIPSTFPPVMSERQNLNMRMGMSSIHTAHKRVRQVGLRSLPICYAYMSCSTTSSATTRRCA